MNIFSAELAFSQPAGVMAQLAVLAPASRLHALAAAIGDMITVASLGAWVAAQEALIRGETLGSEALAIVGLDIIAVAVDTPDDPMAAAVLKHQPAAAIWPLGDLETPAAQFEAARRLASGLGGRLTKTQRGAAAMRRALATLRQDYDNLQTAFADVEAFLGTVGGPILTLCVDQGPSGETTDLVSAPDGGPGGAVSLGLPCGTAGLVAIDLGVEDTDRPCEVTLELTDAGGGMLATTQTALPANAASGWRRLSFPHGVRGGNVDGVASMRLRGLDGPARASLRLSQPSPIPALCARHEDGAQLDAPLALRVWRGLPGVRPPAEGLAEDGTLRLHHGAARAARLLRCYDPDIGFDPISYWEREDGVLVHPPVRGATTAIIERIRLPKVVGVTATIHHAHRGGPSIRFAVAALPGGYGARVDPMSVLSNWVALPPGGWGETHATPDAPIMDEVDLVLGTMVNGGERNNNAWALFRGFAFRTSRK